MDQKKLPRVQQRPGDRKYAKEANRDGGPRMRGPNIYLMKVSKEETKQKRGHI